MKISKINDFVNIKKRPPRTNRDGQELGNRYQYTPESKISWVDLCLYLGMIRVQDIDVTRKMQNKRTRTIHKQLTDQIHRSGRITVEAR